LSHGACNCGWADHQGRRVAFRRCRLLGRNHRADGNLYNDLFTADGGEVTVAARPSTGIVVSERWTKSIGFVKFRSGSRSHPVAQSVDCKFAIAVETIPAA
jgi:hypothetical protein